jgi:hypothetical protein
VLLWRCCHLCLAIADGGGDYGGFAEKPTHPKLSVMLPCRVLLLAFCGWACPALGDVMLGCIAFSSLNEWKSSCHFFKKNLEIEPISGSDHPLHVGWVATSHKRVAMCSMLFFKLFIHMTRN